MASLPIKTLFLVAAFGLYSVAGVSFAVPGNFRFEPTHNGSCLNVLWTACDPPEKCLVTVDWKREKPSSSVGGSRDLYHPVTTPNNSSFTYCTYDSDKVNGSCCMYTDVNADGFAFGDNEYFSILVKHCDAAANKTGNCNNSGRRRYIIPAKNPCYTGKPCKNGGQCVTQIANDYNCTCTSGWEGKDCGTAVINPTTTSAGSHCISILALVFLLLAAVKLM